MKQLVLAWIAVLGLAFALAGSCAIDHRSGAFECAKQADCTPPRICMDNLCVMPGGGGGDAALPDGRTDGSIDARLCPEACTSCDPTTKECTIDCGAGANCTNQVACPAGWNCDIKCDVQNACRNGVNCANAASCVISCKGQGSCRSLACGTGRCNVNCQGTNSCSTVDCNDSCACDVTCSASSACQGIDCPATCGIPRGCSSMLNQLCDRCP